MNKEKLAQKLADDLKETAAYRKLEEAREEIEEDEEASRLLDEFETLRDELQQKQANNSLAKEDMQNFRNAREKLLANPAFQKQQKSAQKLQAITENIVEELSSLIDQPVADYLGGGSC